MGEADGKIKYFDPVMRDGRTPEEVLWDEKRREDGVRRQVHGFTRWGFSIALSRMRFARASAGAWAACSETGPPHVVNGVSVSSAGVAPLCGWLTTRATAQHPRSTKGGPRQRETSAKRAAKRWKRGERGPKRATRRSRHARVAQRPTPVADSSSSTLSTAALHAVSGSLPGSA
ncbi:hypothetical protein E3O59_07340 [Cryobacterium sp. MDB2-33-2]|nr:hypothetical protein E3O39_05970 [Cryobacterium sp. MDB2-A-1]TFC08280.1 hypothetical protein E3O59_07340 [Cryobacterium sp. MDB2-33-2]TFC08547.1 hypothetical protein E3O35_16645 [Cryobacterium sp. MDB2-A-2]